MRSLLSTLFLVPLICSCVSIPVPVHRFDVPETLGKDEKGRHIELSLAIGSTNEVDVSLDPASDLVDPASGTFTHGGFLRGEADIAVLDNLDLGVRADDYYMLHAKFQLLGDSQAKAKAGNFSLALVANIGGNKE